jgi:UDP-GlcNAc:undecaprenyl-phosphate GlcNAc-1-phosphate transferase
MIIKFIISIIISALTSFLLTPLFRNFFIAHSWVEDPHLKQKKTHNATALTAVPRGGGLPIYLAILITSLIFLPLNRYLIGILLASLLTLIVGVWDDLKDISPRLRLITNVLSALIVVGSGIGIAYISNPFGGIINFSHDYLWLVADLLAVLWITWCMNITGWAAGVEGQLPGFVSISAIFIGILGLRFSQDTTQWPVIILVGAVAGSYLGFLPFNFFPQSIMPGYSGKSLAGFFLALLSILSGAKLATLLLLLGVPMIDAFFVIIRRLLHHRPILLSDNQHLHHQLLKSGWSRPQIAVFYWLISLTLGFLSLFLNSQQKMYVFIGLFFLFVGFILKISRRI